MIEYKQLYKEYLIINRNLALSSLNSYLSELTFFADYCQKYDTNLCEVNSEMLRDYLKYLVNSKHDSRNTIIHTITILKSFYGFMLENHYISQDPTLIIDLPIKKPHIPTYITLDEFTTILKQFPIDKPIGFRNHLIIEMLYDSGFRISELLNLTLNSIDLTANTILCKGKGNKERMVMIGEYEHELLVKYLNEIRPILLKNEKSNLLFITNRGHIIKREYVFRKIKEAAVAAGIYKQISPHTFRHSFASSMLENEADLRTIQTLLGHEDISTTQIYTHLSKKQLKKTYQEYHPFGKEGKNES